MTVLNGAARKRFDLKPWETALVAAAAALFVVSAGLYITGFSFRRLFYGDGSFSQKRIGMVADIAGELKRELLGDAEFRAVRQTAPIFNEDTVITGSNSRAKLQLDDESVIELGPDTMVKLSFGNEGVFGGISRAPTIEVVTGKVTGTAAKRDIIIKAQNKEVVLTKQAPKKEIVAEIPKILTLPATPIKVATRVDNSPTEVSLPGSEVNLAPPPPPPPTVPPAVAANIQLLGPSTGARVSVPRGSVSAIVPVKFGWKIEPAPAMVEFVLRRDAKEFKREQVPMLNTTDGTIEVNVDRPGRYEWSIQSVGTDPRVKPFQADSKFTVESAFEGIRLQEALIAGNKVLDNRYSGKKPEDFSVTLRWDEIPGAEEYAVAVLDSPTSPKPLLVRRSKSTELALNPEDSSELRKHPRLYYRVSAALKSGFIARSPVQAVSYSVIAPVPTSPVNGAKVSLATILKDQGRLLFTWQKTDFTDGYEIELSSDEAFSKVFVRKKLKDNFIILKFKNRGNFWWRVRSSFKDSQGPVSQPVSLVIE